jgi:hypothetical protein
VTASRWLCVFPFRDHLLARSGWHGHWYEHGKRQGFLDGSDSHKANTLALIDQARFVSQVAFVSFVQIQRNSGFSSNRSIQQRGFSIDPIQMPMWAVIHCDRSISFISANLRSTTLGFRVVWIFSNAGTNKIRVRWEVRTSLIMNDEAQIIEYEIL